MSREKCPQCNCDLSLDDDGAGFCPNHGAVTPAIEPLLMERMEAISEVTRLRYRLEFYKKRCPMCYQPTVKITTCPIEGPGEGAICTECGWTHMDASPKDQIANKNEKVKRYEEYADRMNPVMEDLAALFPSENEVSDDDLIREAIGEIERLRAKE